ncbi:MAG: type II toxin-antitoxin system VapC family toxin [Ignavibacteria bacterium]|nr:type II toxin-antitoxin system VapC family toxin [Ignavibacteria bacterium]
MICVDTDILIEHKRASKKDKTQTTLYKLSQNNSIAVTVISLFELLRGDSKEDKFWLDFFEQVHVFHLDSESSVIAAKIDKDLKSKGSKLEIRDIFIASICLRNNIELATNNLKHFLRISDLNLYTVE